MTDQPGDFRSWLADSLGRRVRHPVLEDTLFHQLGELERGPLEQLGRLVHMAVDEVRLAQARLAEQACDLRSLEEAVAELTARVDALAEHAVVGRSAPQRTGHLLLLSTPVGYRLAALPGPAPAPGDEVEQGGSRYRVLSHGRSPLAGDRRVAALALPS